MVYEFNRAPMSGSTFHSDRQGGKDSRAAQALAPREDSPMTGSSFHYDNQNANELQLVESPAKVIRTLFGDIWMTLGCFTYLMVLFANWKRRYY